MGIIAGIAIPTTIAVINRQKRNAAASSASTVLDAARTVLIEASAGASSIPGVTVVPATETKPTGYKTTVKALVDNGDLDKNPFTGGSTETGGMTVIYYAGGSTDTGTNVPSSVDVTVESTAKINDFYISYSATTGKFTASSTAPTQG